MMQAICIAVVVLWQLPYELVNYIGFLPAVCSCVCLQVPLDAC